MVILYILSGLWAGGCLGISIITIKMFFEEDIFSGIIAACVITPVLFIVALLPFEGIDHLNSPDLTTLKKHEWACSQTKLVNSTRVVSTGNSTTVVPSTRSVCIVYSKVN